MNRLVDIFQALLQFHKHGILHVILTWMEIDWNCVKQVDVQGERKIKGIDLNFDIAVDCCQVDGVICLGVTMDRFLHLVYVSCTFHLDRYCRPFNFATSSLCLIEQPVVNRWCGLSMAILYHTFAIPNYKIRTLRSTSIIPSLPSMSCSLVINLFQSGIWIVAKMHIQRGVCKHVFYMSAGKSVIFRIATALLLILTLPADVTYNIEWGVKMCRKRTDSGRHAFSQLNLLFSLCTYCIW